MSEVHRITIDPDECGGQPCIRSLRIRVKDVLDLLAAGATAAFEYAARQSDHPVLRVA